MHRFRHLFIALAIWLAAAPAWALDREALGALATGDFTQKAEAIGRLAESPGPRTLTVLIAILDGSLRVDGDGQGWIVSPDGTAVAAATGELAVPSGSAQPVTLNNRLRGRLNAEIASLRLLADDVGERRRAVAALRNDLDARTLAVLRKAASQERDASLRESMQLAMARTLIRSTDVNERLEAVRTLGASSQASVRAQLEAVLAEDAEGRPLETDARVREAAVESLAAVERRLALADWGGRIFAGLSLGSVLMLAAMGLAITFGLLGVINMAHGEMIMIGAYAAYVTQNLFRAIAPEAFGWYPVAAIPVAFLSAALAGIVIERTVIRWLYGRPLETLLATWGVSLMLIQATRQLFGPQNVEIQNPDWLSGGMSVAGLVLPYNRLAIIAFALLVLAAVVLVLQRSRLGLFVRGVTQNRAMASAIGVPTGRVDMLAFGLGSGVAGLAGVALSQIGNVGPELGQAYIIDSFVVVVLGGVGQLLGTVVAGFGLGVVNKLIEPELGAVIGKILILALIVAFIQKRPSGLFALKGRTVEA